MSSFKTFRPEDIDESLVKLIEFSGQCYVLLPFVDATGSAPEYRSLGHSTQHRSIRLEDLNALTERMRRRQQGTDWFILFNTPWLMRQSDGEATRKPRAERK